ncbi:MAG: hypothetical protein KAY37_00795 [Phycisphaerae bacterium]|nr:hypothetical protein [Phycisphaerae bacterium]
MPERRPQINFQVDHAMKLLYEEAKLSGHWVTRFCAAGLLLLVEDPRARVTALNRLREWEAEYEHASPKQIQDFVQGAQDAMQRAARGTRRAPKARPARKAAKRGKSG